MKNQKQTQKREIKNKIQNWKTKQKQIKKGNQTTYKITTNKTQSK